MKAIQKSLAFSALTLTFAMTGTLVSGIATAEEARIPVGSTSAASQYQGALPQRGQSKDQVEAEFGVPDSTHGPSGQPPIYYWEYTNFTVYFESDYVIHAVVKNR